MPIERRCNVSMNECPYEGQMNALREALFGRLAEVQDDLAERIERKNETIIGKLAPVVEQMLPSMDKRLALLESDKAEREKRDLRRDSWVRWAMGIAATALLGSLGTIWAAATRK